MNLSEVAGKLAEGGFSADEVRQAVGPLGLQIHPFDETQALQTGLLRPKTKSLGLSLGDRVCLALRASLSAVALTTDGAWKGLENVEVIR